ncbi:MAG: hypothetical protein ACREJ2_11670 [Planctomycetota bacterium]
MSAGAHTLLLRANGTAELLDARGDSLWASDSDEEFQDQWAGSMFLNESDVIEILDYLVAEGELTEREADACVIDEESFTGEAPELEEEEGEDV